MVGETACGILCVVFYLTSMTCVIYSNEKLNNRWCETFVLTCSSRAQQTHVMSPSIHLVMEQRGRDVISAEKLVCQLGMVCGDCCVSKVPQRCTTCPHETSDFRKFLQFSLNYSQNFSISALGASWIFWPSFFSFRASIKWVLRALSWEYRPHFKLSR